MENTTKRTYGNIDRILFWGVSLLLNFVILGLIFFDSELSQTAFVCFICSVFFFVPTNVTRTQKAIIHSTAFIICVGIYFLNPKLAVIFGTTFYYTQLETKTFYGWVCVPYIALVALGGYYYRICYAIASFLAIAFVAAKGWTYTAVDETHTKTE